MISSVLAQGKPICFGRDGCRRQRRCAFVNSSGYELSSFPLDYPEAIKQARESTESALDDGFELLEVEFPTSCLDAVAGDAEGANEMTYSSEYLRSFSRLFLDKADRTRIFFPDKKEMELQREVGPWSQTNFQLDYFTKPSGFLDIGVDISGYDPSEHVDDQDELFIAAYPSFDPRELVAADKIFQCARKKFQQDGRRRPLIFFNAELDRLRSNYYPGLFYPEMSRLSKEMMPLVESAYYIHNFKGAGGGVLFRAYPGPWQVLLRINKEEVLVVHTQDERPSLKEVALNVLPKAALEYRRRFG